MGKYLDEAIQTRENRSQPGHRDSAGKNTSEGARTIADVITEIYTPTELAQMPRTPEQIAEAKIRLQNACKPVCPICQDLRFVHPWVDGKTDYSHTVPCRCVRKEAEEKKKLNLIKYCEIPAKGQHMTFQNFKRSKLIEEAYQACFALAERKSLEWVTLIGDSGRGKTHLAIAVCHRWLEQGIPAKYVYVPLLLNELIAGFKKDGDESYQSRYNIFLTAPLLAMDDLGTENPTPWAQEKLDTIVDYRCMHNLPTIITTNLPEHKIPFRIARRIKDAGQVIFVDVGKYETRLK